MPSDSHRGDPTRLTFLVTELDAGGAERMLSELVCRLDRDRWQSSVICLGRPGRLVDRLERSGIEVICLGARGAGDLRVLYGLVRELRRRRPALLQTWLYHANVAGAVAGCLAGVGRIVGGIRVAERRAGLRLRFERWTGCCVERHVCVSRGVAEFAAAAGLSSSKLVVIPNGVDADRFEGVAPADLASLGIPPATRVLLVIGRLDRQKAPARAVEVLARLAEARGDVHLLFVGDGPLFRQLERVAADNGLTDRVHLAGRRGDVPALLAAGQALLLPSRWEGMPNVVLEAMAAGLPVIAGDVEGIDELIETGESGLVVPAGDVEQLADATAQGLDDDQFARRLGDAARSRVRLRFSLDLMVRRYDELYRSLLGFES